MFAMPLIAAQRRTSWEVRANSWSSSAEPRNAHRSGAGYRS